MSEPPSIPPLVVEFEVAASVQHAFATWVDRPQSWWPAGHTRSGAPAAIVFEPRTGGQIYEAAEVRSASSAELVRRTRPHRRECRWRVSTGADAGTPSPVRRQRDRSAKSGGPRC